MNRAPERKTSATVHGIASDGNCRALTAKPLRRVGRPAGVSAPFEGVQAGLRYHTQKPKAASQYSAVGSMFVPRPKFGTVRATTRSRRRYSVSADTDLR